MAKTKPKGYWNYYPHVEQAAIECHATSRFTFQQKCMNGYQAARTHGWLDHLAALLKWDEQYPMGHWKVFQNYVDDVWECKATNFAAWTRLSPKAASAAYLYGFVEQIVEEFDWELGVESKPRKKKYAKRHKYGKLKDRDYVLAVANEYETWGEFRDNEESAYNSARTYGFLDYVRENTTATSTQVPYEHWRSLRNCIADIKELGVESMQEWREVCGRGYRGAIRWGHLDALYDIMGWDRKKADGHWDVFQNIVDDIVEGGDASLQAFRVRNVTAYIKMQSNGWERLIRLKFGWSKSVENSELSTYVYRYVHGRRIYIGITTDREGRHLSHQEASHTYVRELANTVEPVYYERVAEYNGVSAPYAMDRDTAMVMERRMIKCAAAQGYEVTNRDHNPQWKGGKYSWETA